MGKKRYILLIHKSGIEDISIINLSVILHIPETLLSPFAGSTDIFNVRYVIK